MSLVGFSGCSNDVASTDQPDAEGDADMNSTDTAERDAETDLDDVDSEPDARVDAEPDSDSMTPLIRSFTVNGGVSATVEPGEEVEVNWESVNTDDCTAGGTLPSWANQDGELSVEGSFSASTTGLQDGEYTLQLSCSGPGGTVSAPDISVTVDVPALDCSTRPPPPNLDRATNINADDETANAFFFAEVFGGPWPGTTNSRRIRVPSTTYVAMEFTTGEHPGDAIGEIQQVPGSTANTSNNSQLWSISKCPGDFRPFVLDEEMGPGCVKNTVRFRFGGADFRDDEARCALETNTTYFLNFFYIDADAALPETNQEHDLLDVDCSDIFCGSNMKPATLRF